jgi:hypothetical protein
MSQKRKMLALLSVGNVQASFGSLHEAMPARKGRLDRKSKAAFPRHSQTSLGLSAV